MHRHRSALRTIVLGPVLVLASAPAHAQLIGGGSSGDEDPPQESYTLQQPSTPGTLNRSCAGDFDGDGTIDAALLSDTRIELVLRAGSLGWWHQTTVEANDLSARPRPAWASKDKFVAVGTGGAKLCSMDGLSFNLSVIQDTVWDGATLVDSALTDVGGGVLEERIVGVMGNGSLQMLRFVGPGWETSEIVLQTPSSRPIVELELVDLDGDQEFELVLARQDGAGTELWFHELSGQNLLPAQAYPSRTTTSLTSGTQSNGNGFVALTTRKANGVEHLYAFDATGLASTTYMGSPGVVGSTTSTWSEDASSDVVLSLSEKDELWVLTNLGTSRPSFALSNYTRIDHGQDPSSNAAEPASADVDGDGDEDLLFALQGSAELSVHRNAATDHLETAPLISTPEDFSYAVAETDGECAAERVNNYVWLTLSADAPPQTQATHIAYAIWMRADLDTSTPGTAIAGGSVLLDLSDPTLIRFQLPNPETLGCGPDGTQFSKLYYFQLMLEKRDAAGVLIQTFTPLMFGIQTHPTQQVNAVHLAQNRVSSSTSPIYVSYSAGGVPPAGSDPETVGTLDQIRDLPDVVAGEPIINNF